MPHLFAFTPPLPPPGALAPFTDALHGPDALRMAAVSLCCALAAFLAARLSNQPRRPDPAQRPANAPQTASPFYDIRVRRWRCPTTNRFVKAPVGA